MTAAMAMLPRFQSPESLSGARDRPAPSRGSRPGLFNAAPPITGARGPRSLWGHYGPNGPAEI